MSTENDPVFNDENLRLDIAELIVNELLNDPHFYSIPDFDSELAEQGIEEILHQLHNHYASVVIAVVSRCKEERRKWNESN